MALARPLEHVLGEKRTARCEENHEERYDVESDAAVWTRVSRALLTV